MERTSSEEGRHSRESEATQNRLEFDPPVEVINAANSISATAEFLVREIHKSGLDAQEARSELRSLREYLRVLERSVISSVEAVATRPTRQQVVRRVARGSRLTEAMDAVATGAGIDELFAGQVLSLIEQRDYTGAKGVAHAVRRDTKNDPWVADLLFSIIALQTQNTSAFHSAIRSSRPSLLWKYCRIAWLEWAIGNDESSALTILREIIPDGVEAAELDLIVRMLLGGRQTSFASKCFSHTGADDKNIAHERGGYLFPLSYWHRLITQGDSLLSPKDPGAETSIDIGVWIADTPTSVGDTDESRMASIAMLASIAMVSRSVGAETRFVGPLANLVDLAASAFGAARPGRPSEAPASRAIALHPVHAEFSDLQNMQGVAATLVSGDLSERWLEETSITIDRRINPFYIGVSVDPSTDLSGSLAEHLRKCGPIGCADRSTALLLSSSGIPAFLSGGFELASTTADRGPVAAAVSCPESVDVELQDPQAAIADRIRYRTAKIVNDLAVSSVVRPIPSVPSSAMELADWLGGEVLVTNDIATLRRAWRRHVAPLVAKVLRNYRLGVADLRMRPSLASAISSLSSSVPQLPKDFADSPPTVNLAFSTDNSTWLPFTVAAGSAIRNCSDKLNIWVLTRGVSPQRVEAFRSKFPGVNVSQIRCDDVSFGNVLGLARWISVSTMDRLLLPSLLSKVGRILYLDVDLLVQGDVSDLFSMQLKGKALAARPARESALEDGFSGILAASKRLKGQRHDELNRRCHLTVPKSFITFNAGVLLMDLDRMRTDEFVERYVPLAIRYGLNDQEILNMYAGAEYEPLEARWNAVPLSGPTSGAKIIHWSGVSKPWNSIFVSDQEKWLEQPELVE